MTSSTTKRAWEYLCSENAYKLQKDGTFHWVDNESDTGLLKDADALNTLIEPFLLASSFFVDPPMKAEELYQRAANVLKIRGSLVSEKDDLTKKKSDGLGYRGFSAAPYPYVDIPVDYVDSAATLLNLICNIVDLASVTKRSIPGDLMELMRGTATSASEFLDESCVVDDNGARWAGINKRSDRDPPQKYANLFFTHIASLALQRVLGTQVARRWIDESLCKRAEEKLQMVPLWVEHQYDDAIKAFWMDEIRRNNIPVSAVYALEIVYHIGRRPEDPLREYCQEALSTVLAKMKTPRDASTLQIDTFHILPNPTGGGTIFYDDRKYIGSFLSLLSLIKVKDPDMVNEEFIGAGEMLFRAVSTEWRDDPTGLWDDGRPLICYTYDALKGLIQYSLEGAVGTISLRENDLRDAIRAALDSTDIGDIIWRKIREKHLSLQDKEFQEKFTEKSAVSASK